MRLNESSPVGYRAGRRPRQVVVSALILVLAFLGACGDESEIPVASRDLTGMDADNVVYGMNQLLTERGIREGVVQADTAYFFEDSTAVHLLGVNMALFNEDGSERAQVTSERGRLDAESEDLVARGNVVLQILGQDRRIETEVLNYSSMDDLIWSDTTTIMEEDGDVTCGSAFRSDLDFQDVRITRARTTGCRP